MMLLQHRNYFLGDLVYDMAERSERLAKCLKCKIFMFWQNKKTSSSSHALKDQSFPSQNLSFLQKETFFSFCCSSWPAVPFLDAQMGWFSSGPCLAPMMAAERKVEFIMDNWVQLMDCLVMDTLLQFLIQLLLLWHHNKYSQFFSIFLLSSYTAEVHSHCNSQHPHRGWGISLEQQLPCKPVLGLQWQKCGWS